MAGAVALLVVVAGCDTMDRVMSRVLHEQPVMPDVATVEGYFQEHRNILQVAIDGNVVELEVQQPVRQILRGGALWARVGPYVYLLSPGVQELFADHRAVAGVRVTTVLPDGERVAWALLKRDALSEINWKRAHNLLGHALQPGREQPRRLEELRIWGEEHTEYWYNPDYIDR